MKHCYYLRPSSKFFCLLRLIGGICLVEDDDLSRFIINLYIYIYIYLHERRLAFCQGFIGHTSSWHIRKQETAASVSLDEQSDHGS